MIQLGPRHRIPLALHVASSAFALVVAACGGAAAGPPEIVLDHSACDACGMLISDPAFAAGYQVGRDTAVFDDIGCLLRALDEADATTASVWFLDGEQRWFDASQAVFVRSAQLETPMGGHIQAFADRARAEQMATKVRGTVVENVHELAKETSWPLP